MGSREREEKVSWAQAASLLLPNCHSWFPSHRRDSTQFACYQSVFWWRCVDRSSEHGSRRCTTIPQCNGWHNSYHCVYHCPCPCVEHCLIISAFILPLTW